jgi:hypothetical protein
MARVVKYEERRPTREPKRNKKIMEVREILGLDENILSKASCSFKHKIPKCIQNLSECRNINIVYS